MEFAMIFFPFFTFVVGVVYGDYHSKGGEKDECK
jgi:hypothetical protein